MGRPGGSQTAARQEARERIRGIPGAIRGWIASPIDSLAAIGEEAAFRAKSEAIATLLFDPSFKKDVINIKRMAPSEAAVALQKLLNGIVTGTTAATAALSRVEDGR